VGAKEARIAAIYSLVFFLAVYVSTSSTVWFHGGNTVPGRYLLITLPLLMAFLAKALGERGRGLQFLALYTGLVMVGGFLALLPVIGEVGRFFGDPFTLTQYHGLLSSLPGFYYKPHVETALAPAIYLYLASLLFVFIPARSSPWIHRVVIIALVFIYGFSAYIDGVHEGHARSPLRTAQSFVQINRMRDPLVVAGGERSTAVPLLKYSNQYQREDPWSLKGVTTDRLPSISHDGWISVPHLNKNDWSGRPYRWVTLISPFKPGRGHLAIFFEAILSGESGGELCVREGAFDRSIKTFAPNEHLRELISLQTEGTGDIYLLFRFTGEQGRLETKRISASAYDPALLEKVSVYVGVE
jgi:hypothetical protein